MVDIFLASFFISIFLLIQLVYRRDQTTRFGAPFVPLGPELVSRIMDLAVIKRGEVFFDLGSGDGRLVIAAAMRGAKAYGVEIDPFRVWYSRLWIFLLRLRGQATIIQKDIFEADISSADIITAYLLQETNNKLQPKLEKEAKKGARILGIAFNFPKWKPIAVDPQGPIYGPIYLYKR